MRVDKVVIKISLATIIIIFGLDVSPVISQENTSGTADDTQSGGVIRPGAIPLDIPAPGEPASSPIDIETKEPVFKKKKAVYGKRIFVREIKISGNTVFTSEELKKITSHYENRTVYNSELEDARIALTQKYIDNGYINSGAVIPDHKVVDGVIKINIIEGKLTEIEVVGNKHLESDYIKERLKLGAATPLNVNELQEQIQVMLESPSIATINSALRPGDKRGEASLTAAIQEGPRFEFNPTIDNRISPSLGSHRKLLPFKINNMTGVNDSLSLAFGRSDGLKDANLNWDFPDIEETTFSFFGSYSDSEIVKGSFKDLNVVNKAKSVGVKVTHPLHHTSKSKSNVALSLELRKNKSELLGQGFAFSAGVPSDGIVKETVVRFSQDWTKRGLNEVVAYRSLFSFGIDAFGATINGNNQPSGEFITWLGQFQWAKLLTNDMGQVILKSNVQLTNDPLFGMEQFSLGGSLSVRGYLENQIVRDKGFNVSLEYRYPLLRDATGRSILTIAPFIDAGGSTNTEQPDGTDPDYISSIGIGIRWNPISKVHAQVYWAHANDEIDNDIESLQDGGFHFLLSANLTDWF